MYMCLQFFVIVRNWLVDMGCLSVLSYYLLIHVLRYLHVVRYAHVHVLPCIIHVHVHLYMSCILILDSQQSKTTSFEQSNSTVSMPIDSRKSIELWQLFNM